MNCKQICPRVLLLLFVGLFLTACSYGEPQVMEAPDVVVETETITEVVAEEIAVEVTRIVCGPWLLLLGLLGWGGWHWQNRRKRLDRN
jgi:hypothetical protein